jgi:hypothetical protein
MPHRRHLREQLRLDVVAGPQNLDRVNTGVVRGLDEILALDDEQALPIGVAAVASVALRYLNEG